MTCDWSHACIWGTYWEPLFEAQSVSNLVGGSQTTPLSHWSAADSLCVMLGGVSQTIPTSLVSSPVSMEP